jgi:periplasmic protein TonB
MKRALFVLILLFPLWLAAQPDKLNTSENHFRRSDTTAISLVDQPAEFPGGLDSLRKYIAEHIKYPVGGSCATGRVMLEFVVTSEGKITHITVLRGIPGAPEFDAEAVRLVENMPDWIPGKLNGVNVNSYYDLPVRFR